MGIVGLIRIEYVVPSLRSRAGLSIACVEYCLPYGDSTSKMFWRIYFVFLMGFMVLSIIYGMLVSILIWRYKND